MKRTWTSESALGLRSGILAGCPQAGRSGERPWSAPCKTSGKAPSQRGREAAEQQAEARQPGPPRQPPARGGRRACPAARGAPPLLTFERRRARALRTSPARPRLPVWPADAGLPGTLAWEGGRGPEGQPAGPRRSPLPRAP